MREVEVEGPVLLWALSTSVLLLDPCVPLWDPENACTVTPSVEGSVLTRKAGQVCLQAPGGGK